MRTNHPKSSSPHDFFAGEPGAQITRNAAFSGSAVAATVVVGSLATRPDGEWYQNLKKPLWQPPPSAFPVVWTGLYANIAITSTAVLNEFERRGDHEKAADYRKALSTNLALNGLWSWLFFRWHHLGLATVGAGVLAVNSVKLAKRAADARPRYGKRLSIYAAWTSFATVLAAAVWWHNRDQG